jgi:hypothetical protein
MQAQSNGAFSGKVADMQECLVVALSRRRHEIHRRWEELLRLEGEETPLANPAVLVHLIDWTLSRIFDQLRDRKTRNAGKSPRKVAALRAHCACGHNPLLKLFLTGEQALLEALVLVQVGDASLDPSHRDTAVAELYLVINDTALREIDALCSVCRNRAHLEALPHSPVSPSISGQC